MIIRRKMHLLLPLVALSLALPMVASGATSASLQISFGTRPQWTNISGTRVEMIRQADRPAYDVFRYDGTYYAYNNDQWYTSSRESGDFRAMDDRYLPGELRRVPRDRWRNYPSAWDDRNYQGPGGPSASMQVNFRNNPRWMNIRGTRVRVIHQADRSGYDMFRYGRYYYTYNSDSNRWYISRNWRGQFTLLDNRSVPRELRRVPRQHWRNYPSAWEDRGYQGRDGTSASFQVNFGSRPRWTGISGTRVEMIRQGERPAYDVFRYGGTYYVYNNDRWYASSRESGNFTVIDDRSVPSEFSRVPRDNWRNYPSAWEDRSYQGPGGTSASLQISFGSRPHWTGISGTRVEMIPMAERSDYDVFRYGGAYYAYDNNRWYTSNRESGNFTAIDDRSVPSDFSSIPRDQWRSYPSAWQNRYDSPTGYQRDNRDYRPDDYTR